MQWKVEENRSVLSPAAQKCSEAPLAALRTRRKAFVNRGEREQSHNKLLVWQRDTRVRRQAGGGGGERWSAERGRYKNARGRGGAGKDSQGSDKSAARGLKKDAHAHAHSKCFCRAHQTAPA